MSQTTEVLHSTNLQRVEERKVVGNTDISKILSLGLDHAIEAAGGQWKKEKEGGREDNSWPASRKPSGSPKAIFDITKVRISK